MIRVAVVFAALALGRPTTHVACIGDSNTASWGASSEIDGYPARLGLLLGPEVTVKAFGAPSTTAGDYGPDPYTASQAYADAGAWLAELPATAAVDVVLYLGTNDLVSASFTPAAFAMEYQARASHFMALAPHPRLFTVIPTYVGAELEAPGIAATGGTVVDLRPSWHPWLTSADGVHPSDAGHAMIGRLLWDAM